ncbi:hypothetical protein SteCoe_25511 [Stentor coeruleus]|uniref:Uncharacterized protein n=1 Tax=Stentor coeruleus TaxID=5963 RepID=A0A1R2BFD5_9CILI|nr:hypothetical protein SteCoe_25511 [Stentor coeruleus]
MSKKNSILKSRESSASPHDKRVSWGNKSTIEFPDGEGPLSQTINDIENPEEEEVYISTPYPATENSRGFEYPYQGPQSVVSRFLTPVFEENESSQPSQRSSFDSQMSMNYLFPETEIPCLKPLEWSFPIPKTIKKTPKKNSDHERLLRETNEKNLQSEDECEIIKTQVRNYMNINNKNKENINNYYKKSVLYRKFDANYENDIEKNFKYAVTYANNINDKHLNNLGGKDHWTEPLNVDNYGGKVFRHKTTMVDDSLYSCLALKITTDKTFLNLTTELPWRNVGEIWEKLRIFIENCAVGSEERILEKVCLMWCSFVKFTQSYQKLNLSSDNITVEVKDYIAIIRGYVLKTMWEVEIPFANIEDNWDVAASAFKQIRR